jgi:hypothetical protein
MESSGSDITIRRTKADWDNYLKEKLIELRQLVDQAGEYLNPDMANK